ncbi:hypothetical protein Dimus_004407 [Dionaea muscipula]
MAQTRRHQETILRIAAVLTLAFLISLSLLPPSISAVMMDKKRYIHRISLTLHVGVWVCAVEQVSSKKVLMGSRPPICKNRCLSCRPCMATLVVPPHQNNKGTLGNSISYYGHGDGDGNGDGTTDNYYLLSWKCKCGSKLFQP